jgi:hypothetical protein
MFYGKTKLQIAATIAIINLNFKFAETQQNSVYINNLNAT